MKTNKKHPINLIGISGKMGSGKDTVGSILQWIVTSKTGFGNGTYSNKECVEWLNGKYPGDTSIQEISNYQIKKFADKLKDMACLLIGCTREQLEDREFKEKELGEEWWYCKKRILRDVVRLVNYRDAEDGLELIKLTPRKLLQLLGTEAGREIIHPNIWVNALFADYKVTNNCSQHSDGLWYTSEHGEAESEVTPVYPNWIITDVRFPNEAKAIKDRGGIVIRVNRPIYKIFDVTGSKEDILIPFVKEYKREPTKEELNSLRIGEDGKYLEGKEHPSETALDNYEFDHVIDNNGSIEELVEKVKQLNLV